MASVTLMEARGLTRHFGGLKAVDGVDFTLMEGEIHALIGPNGAGKTTFVSLLSGRVPAQSGTILLRGRDITRLPAHARVHAGIAYTFQITQVFAALPVFDNVALAVQSRGGRPIATEAMAALERVGLAERADLARLTWDSEAVANRRPAPQRFGRALVVPPAGAFLQATPDGEAALVAAVREAVGGARRVADLFAGSGTFTLPLAENAEIHAVEGEAAMLVALDGGWRLAQGLHKVTTEARDLFSRPLMPDELKRFDAVVIDPPRAGAEAQMRELAMAKVPVIAGVSCNPVTFARDTRILSDSGYRIDWVQVVDQFRWSPHVELVARLSL